MRHKEFGGGLAAILPSRIKDTLPTNALRTNRDFPYSWCLSGFQLMVGYYSLSNRYH